MPRYPNVWFYVDSSIVNKYREALCLITYSLEKYCHIVDDFSLYYRLPRLLFGFFSEGCNMEARRKKLQPYTDLSNPHLSHDHQLHVRYYFSDLVRNKLEKVKLDINGKGFYFYRLALSVHYEVGVENKNHPYVEFCPICGRTGEYDVEIDRNNVDKDICRKIHDPLGVELLLKSTIRGRGVSDDMGKRVRFIEEMKKDYDLDIYILNPKQEDINTPKVGCILVKHKK